MKNSSIYLVLVTYLFAFLIPIDYFILIIYPFSLIVVISYFNKCNKEEYIKMRYYLLLITILLLVLQIYKYDSIFSLLGFVTPLCILVISISPYFITAVLNRNRNIQEQRERNLIEKPEKEKLKKAELIIKFVVLLTFMIVMFLILLNN
jgi:Ca2+/Na+ antiporter